LYYYCRALICLPLYLMGVLTTVFVCYSTALFCLLLYCPILLLRIAPFSYYCIALFSLLCYCTLLVSIVGVSSNDKSLLRDMATQIQSNGSYGSIRVCIYMYIVYSQTCIKRSLLGQRKIGLIRQVTSYKRFNSYDIFYDRKKSDLLIQVTV